MFINSLFSFHVTLIWNISFPEVNLILNQSNLKSQLPIPAPEYRCICLHLQESQLYLAFGNLRYSPKNPLSERSEFGVFGECF